MLNLRRSEYSVIGSWGAEAKSFWDMHRTFLGLYNEGSLLHRSAVKSLITLLSVVFSTFLLQH